MGSPCSKSNVAVSPVALNATTVNISNAEQITSINVIWLGDKNVPYFSTLRRQFNQIYAFEQISHSIEMINSLQNPTCSWIYIIHDNFKTNDISKNLIDQIHQLKPIYAIYIYHEDKNILSSYPSVCTVSNDNHLTNQLKMVAKHLGVIPILDRSIVDTIHFDEDDIRIEIYENTFNALLNSVERLKFVLNNEMVNDGSSKPTKKDKKTNITWAAEFVVSNINISFKESDAETSHNTVYVIFTAMVTATLTSVNIPLWITNKEVEPGLSRTSAMKGEGVIKFDLEKNKFVVKALKAIVAEIDIKVYTFKDYDAAGWMSPFDLPGPMNWSQLVPIPSDMTTTTDGVKTTAASISDFKMRCQNKRLILSLKLDYQTMVNKITS